VLPPYLLGGVVDGGIIVVERSILWVLYFIIFICFILLLKIAFFTKKLILNAPMFVKIFALYCTLLKVE